MRILILRVGAMGDVLHALPAVTALKRVRPDWAIDWVIDERWEPLLAGDERPGSIVRRTFPVPVRQWKREPFSRATFASFARFRKLRSEYDLVVDMQGTMRSALIASIAGGRNRVAGYADPRESAAKWMYGKPIARAGRHVVQQGAALLSAATGVPLDPVAVDIPLTGWAEHWAEHEAVLARPLALLAPSAGWGAKQWPVARFAALAAELRTRGADVVVNAPRKDDALANELHALSQGAARIVVCNVAGLIALMRRTDLFVGGDSGPMHLAAALAVPTVALFGPTSPERNGPWGPGPKRVLRDPASATTYKRSAEVEAGLARISVEQVLTAIDEMQAETRASF